MARKGLMEAAEEEMGGFSEEAILFVPKSMKTSGTSNPVALE
jgi:hypothetical protein